MDVKEVTKTAREYVADVFADEEISQLGLEEVLYDVDSDEWRITFGFARPWDQGKHRSSSDGHENSPAPTKWFTSTTTMASVTALTDRLLPDLKV